MATVVKHRHTPHQYVVVPGGKYWLRNLPARQALERRERITERFDLNDAEMESYGPIIGSPPDDTVDAFGVPVGKRSITPTWYSYSSNGVELRTNSSGSRQVYYNGSPKAAGVYSRFATREFFTPPFTVTCELKCYELKHKTQGGKIVYPFEWGGNAQYTPYVVAHLMHDMQHTPTVGNKENIIVGWSNPFADTPTNVFAELPDGYGYRTGQKKATRSQDPLDMRGKGWRPFKAEILSHDHYRAFWDDKLIAEVWEEKPATMSGKVGFAWRWDFYSIKFRDFEVVEG